MPFHKVCSHDPLTGDKKIQHVVLPAVATNNSDFNTSQDLENSIKKLGFPCEIGYVQKGDSATITKIYEKQLLLTVEAKITALLGLLEEGVIDEKTFCKKILFKELSSLEFPRLKPAISVAKFAQGNGFVPGAVVGRVVFNAEDLDKTENAIWVMDSVTNEHTKLFPKASAIVLTKSGATSHAAILAKNLAIPTIIGGGELFSLDAGSEISLDGQSGAIYIGRTEIETNNQFALLEKAKQIYKNNIEFEVLANAETKKDLTAALKAGATGVGLCRTEHMFLEAERLASIQQILFQTEINTTDFQKLLAFQTDDFTELFELLPQSTIVIRYLDAPLHEFGGDKEQNPMLGFRAVRMLLAKPQIIELQTQAIINAWEKVAVKPNVIIELPLVVSVNELKQFIAIVKNYLSKANTSFVPEFAVMLETPRACITASELAEEVGYFSFGTNDLTQMTFGFSRDDSADFIKNYLTQSLLNTDPFIDIDESGVGFLMEHALKTVKKHNPNAHFIVCGEQASNLQTQRLLKQIGIDGISVSAGKMWQAIYNATQL